jgi:hypothetical protein
MESRPCPVCKGTTVIPDHVRTDEILAPRFIPCHSTGPGVSLTFSFLSCCSCGHIWSSVDPKDLRSYIEEHGNELVRQQLEPYARDPFHGLPDCPDAHEAAKGVAEIDDLVFTGKTIEAIRRYRELTHTKWGQAGEDVRAWHNLKRVRKLAMFGWHSKEAEIEGKSAPEHPMRDRWLDG